MIRRRRILISFSHVKLREILLSIIRDLIVWIMSIISVYSDMQVKKFILSGRIYKNTSGILFQIKNNFCNASILFFLFTSRNRSLGQGNVFTTECQSFYSRRKGSLCDVSSCLSDYLVPCSFQGALHPGVRCPSRDRGLYLGGLHPGEGGSASKGNWPEK